MNIQKQTFTCAFIFTALISQSQDAFASKGTCTVTNNEGTNHTIIAECNATEDSNCEAETIQNFIGLEKNMKFNIASATVSVDKELDEYARAEVYFNSQFYFPGTGSKIASARSDDDETTETEDAGGFGDTVRSIKCTIYGTE